MISRKEKSRIKEIFNRALEAGPKYRRKKFRDQIHREIGPNPESRAEFKRLQDEGYAKAIADIRRTN